MIHVPSEVRDALKTQIMSGVVQRANPSLFRILARLVAHRSWLRSMASVRNGADFIRSRATLHIYDFNRARGLPWLPYFQGFRRANLLLRGWLNLQVFECGINRLHSHTPFYPLLIRPGTGSSGAIGSIP